MTAWHPGSSHMVKGSEMGSPTVRAGFQSHHPQWWRDACPALGHPRYLQIPGRHAVQGSCLLSEPQQGCLSTPTGQTIAPRPPCLNPVGWDLRPGPGCYRDTAAGSPGQHTKPCCEPHHEWQPFFTPTPGHHHPAAFPRPVNTKPHTQQGPSSQ